MFCPSQSIPFPAPTLKTFPENSRKLQKEKKGGPPLSRVVLKPEVFPPAFPQENLTSNENFQAQAIGRQPWKLSVSLEFFQARFFPAREYQARRKVSGFLDVFLDVINRITDCGDFFRVFIRNFNVKFLFKRHH